MRMRLVSILTMCLIGPTAVVTAEGTNSTKLTYPETRRVDQTDEYFGVQVPDPYRWLEADIHESREVAEWAKKQNDITRNFLDTIPQRPAIEKRLTELWNYERYSPPIQKGGKYFFLKNDGHRTRRFCRPHPIGDCRETPGGLKEGRKPPPPGGAPADDVVRRDGACFAPFLRHLP